MHSNHWSPSRRGLAITVTVLAAMSTLSGGAIAASPEPPPDTRCGDTAYGVEVDRDGRIVVASEVGTSLTVAHEDGDVVQVKDLAISRLLPDGSLDVTYGNGGTTIVDAGGDDEVLDVRLDADGRALVMGRVNGADDSASVAVLRFDTDGTLDPTYGTEGMARIALEPDTFAWAADTHEGGLVLAGRIGSDANKDYAVMRLTDAGELDATFGTAGLLRVDRGDADEVFESVAVDATSGAIYAAGSQRTNGITEVLRLDAMGKPDATWGEGGWVVPAPHPGAASRATVLAVDADSQDVIVASDVDRADDSRAIAITRLGEDGTPVMTFGAAGQTIVDLGADITYVWDGTFQADGADPASQAFVIVGTDIDADFAAGRGFLLRVGMDGGLDATFGEQGVVRPGLPTPFGFLADVEATSGGQLIAVGSAIAGFEAQSSDLLVVAVGPDGRLDTTFGNGGLVVRDLRGPVCAPDGA